jgi:hypothetical protein
MLKHIIVVFKIFLETYLMFTASVVNLLWQLVLALTAILHMSKL